MLGGAPSVVRGNFRAQPRHMSSLPPFVWTDPRLRAAYSEGAGIYRIVPAGVAVPRRVDELQQIVR